MADPTEQDHIERITLRLRKDHPDPAERTKLYEDGKLPDYVRALLPDADDAQLKRVTAAVHAAEDGEPTHDL